jgi:predicted enzyme related to lactoylglutathione lyase
VRPFVRHRIVRTETADVESMSAWAHLNGILETAIHAVDLARSQAFYEGVLGLTRS